MPAKKRRSRNSPRKSAAGLKNYSVASLIADPVVATALIVFALIALVLSIMEFTSAVAK